MAGRVKGRKGEDGKVVIIYDRGISLWYEHLIYTST